MAVTGVQSLNTGSDCFGEAGAGFNLGYSSFFFNFNDFIKLMLTGFLIADVIYYHINVMSIYK